MLLILMSSLPTFSFKIVENFKKVLIFGLFFDERYFLSLLMMLVFESPLRKSVLSCSTWFTCFMVWSSHLQEDWVGHPDEQIVMHILRIIRAIQVIVENGEIRQVPPFKLNRKDQRLQQVHHFRRNRRLIGYNQNALIQKNHFPQPPHQIRLFHGQNKMLLTHFHPIMGVWPRFAFQLHRRCFISNYFSYFWQLPCWYDSQNGAAFPYVPLAQTINKTRCSPDKINYSISKRWYQLIFCISCQFTYL